MIKKLLFIFSMLSLIGFFVGAYDGNRYSGTNLFVVWLRVWSYFTVPLVILLIYKGIFLKDE